jgi:hypothetical protein
MRKRIQYNKKEQVCEATAESHNERDQENERIEELRIRIEEVRGAIERAQMECKDLESTFVQAAKRCKVKWYANSWVREPPEANRLRELIYWTS